MCTSVVTAGTPSGVPAVYIPLLPIPVVLVFLSLRSCYDILFGISLIFNAIMSCVWVLRFFTRATCITGMKMASWVHMHRPIMIKLVKPVPASDVQHTYYDQNQKQQAGQWGKTSSPPATVHTRHTSHVRHPSCTAHGERAIGHILLTHRLAIFLA